MLVSSIHHSSLSNLQIVGLKYCIYTIHTDTESVLHDVRNVNSSCNEVNYHSVFLLNKSTDHANVTCVKCPLT